MSSVKVSMAAPHEVQTWVENGSAMVFDVREPHEYAAGHIPGAVSNPLSQFDPRKVPHDPSRHIVLNCLSGARCGVAAQLLERAGYTGSLHRLQGGLVAWRQEGGPLENSSLEH
ncbi:rhodanese-like domain-containing protein [Pararhodospirillum photometricum]|nr:rhodanese-like domain-containing protein [Pararhodospirillum photometricum]